MIIRFKKLCPNAKTPVQATDGSAGFDLTAVSDPVTVGSFGWDLDATTPREYPLQLRYQTGIAVEIPKGYVGLVFCRSSVWKHCLRMTNSVGVIDSDYRGEITFVFDCPADHQIYHQGDRIGQLVIVPIPQVEFVASDTLSETKRGTGGYGSTGD